MAPPQLAIQAPLVGGGPAEAVAKIEAVDRIVLRSKPGLSAEAYLQANPHYAGCNERLVSPSRASQQLAERLGRFDGDPRSTLPLVRRSVSRNAAGLPDPMCAGATLAGVPGLNPGTLSTATADGLATTAGGLGPVEKALVTVDFGSPDAWPDPPGFVLRVVEGFGAPTWDPDGRVLRVPLVKGEATRVDLSSLLRGEELELMGLWGWAVEHLDAEISDRGERARRLEEIRRMAVLGLADLLTPRHTITLVHALQQPKSIHDSPDLDHIRLPGCTWVHVIGSVPLHFPSTGSFELVATWTEPLDDPDHPGLPPADMPFSAHVLREPIKVPDPLEPTPPALRGISFDPAGEVAELVAPDPAGLERKIGGAADSLEQAFARLSEAADLTPEEVIDRFGLRSHHELAIPLRWEKLLESASALPPAEIYPLLLQEMGAETFDGDQIRDLVTILTEQTAELIDLIKSCLGELSAYPITHEFGDYKRRRVDYEVVATSRHADLFLSADGTPLEFSVESDGFMHDIPSSASPAPPQARYVVPSFNFRRTGSDEPDFRITSTRTGGLRVYLERPWFDSGVGDLLGVVLGDESAGPGFAGLTHWGMNPLWASPAIGGAPVESEFSGAARVGRGLRVPGDDAAGRVTVLGYEVQFDGAGACFCDIGLDPGAAYFPLVRLALVRYQPGSLPGLELSRLVIADLTQLPPTRKVRVERVETAFFVSVTGQTHRSPTDPLAPDRVGTRVRVTVQSAPPAPGFPDDAAWVDVVDGATVNASVPVPDGELLWAGRVEISGLEFGNFRLLIEELEGHRRMNTGPGSPSSTFVERVVFAETVELAPPSPDPGSTRGPRGRRTSTSGD